MTKENQFLLQNIYEAHQDAYNAARKAAIAYIDTAIKPNKVYALSEEEKQEAIDDDEFNAYATVCMKDGRRVELGIISLKKDSNGLVMITGHDYYSGEIYENVYPENNIDTLNAIVYFVYCWYDSKNFNTPKI